MYRVGGTIVTTLLRFAASPGLDTCIDVGGTDEQAAVAVPFAANEARRGGEREGKVYRAPCIIGDGRKREWEGRKRKIPEAFFQPGRMAKQAARECKQSGFGVLEQEQRKEIEDEQQPTGGPSTTQETEPCVPSRSASLHSKL